MCVCVRARARVCVYDIFFILSLWGSILSGRKFFDSPLIEDEVSVLSP